MSKIQVIAVGWQRDVDNNRHPVIRVAGNDWFARWYDHPADSWTVIDFEITAPRSAYFDGEKARAEFSKRTGGEIADTTPLDRIAGDLYDYGPDRATARWKGETVELEVEN